MILWTIQPIEVWEELNRKGYYICNAKKSENLIDDVCNFKLAYDWLVRDMETKIGKRPIDVLYPIWAWHTRNWKHKKPDLRESGYDAKGVKSVCIEIEIPDNQVLLSDFDAWHFVLNHSWLDNSTSEEEYDKNQIWFDSLSYKEQEILKEKSWQGIYDIRPFENDWFQRGRYIQATFWKLELSQVQKVQFFVAR